MGAKRDPIKAAEALRARLPHTPPAVVERVVATRRLGPLPRRGVIEPLDAYFAGLAAAGRPPEQAIAEDFRHVATKRHRLYQLLWALETWAPELPLSAARLVRQEWDKWLNDKWNKKEPKPRKTTRVALPPEDWPPAWRAALPLLGRNLSAPGGRVLKALRPKTRKAVIQAVGMFAAARMWALSKDATLDETMSKDLVDAFVRYAMGHRGVSAISARSYLERTLSFALRGRLLGLEDEQAFRFTIACLIDEAEEAPPEKREKVRAFARRFDLGDVLIRGAELAERAAGLPGHTAEAARLRLKAMTFALLINGGDRQGDLLDFTIGREVVRRPNGLWGLDFRQGKTRGWKTNSELWLFTSSLIDRHILGDRPDWMIETRLEEVQGLNLLTLSPEPFGSYRPSAFLQEEFEISGHLVRSLIVDALKLHQPDAAWAAQALLGHTNRTMQLKYQSDFREAAAIMKYHRTIEELAAAAVV